MNNISSWLSSACFSLWPPELPIIEKILRLGYGSVALYGLFFGLIPAVLYGIVNTGVMALLLCGAMAGFAYLYQPCIREKFFYIYRITHPIFFVLLTLGCVLYIGFCISYRQYCRRNPPPNGAAPQTVIVLGAGIEGDRPKLMLSRRLIEASRYLEQNPEAICIVSGGQGPDEDYPEAEVMRNYMIELGADGSRILMEDRSEDTLQNIKYSADIIEQQQLSREACVVSDAFHQLRAAYFCRRNGLTPRAITSLTPWGLLPSYEIRELGAWIKAWIFG